MAGYKSLVLTKESSLIWGWQKFPHHLSVPANYYTYWEKPNVWSESGEPFKCEACVLIGRAIRGLLGKWQTSTHKNRAVAEWRPSTFNSTTMSLVSMFLHCYLAFLFFSVFSCNFRSFYDWKFDVMPLSAVHHHPAIGGHCRFANNDTILPRDSEWATFICISSSSPIIYDRFFTRSQSIFCVAGGVGCRWMWLVLGVRIGE